MRRGRGIAPLRKTLEALVFLSKTALRESKNDEDDQEGRWRRGISRFSQATVLVAERIL
jgi:hypothetical protein